MIERYVIWPWGDPYLLSRLDYFPAFPDYIKLNVYYGAFKLPEETRLQYWSPDAHVKVYAIDKEGKLNRYNFYKCLWSYNAINKHLELEYTRGLVSWIDYELLRIEQNVAVCTSNASSAG